MSTARFDIETLCAGFRADFAEQFSINQFSALNPEDSFNPDDIQALVVVQKFILLFAKKVPNRGKPFSEASIILYLSIFIIFMFK